MRFQVRDATGPNWDWLPDWVVVDTEKKVRVAAYDDEERAREDCAERNLMVQPTAEQLTREALIALCEEAVRPENKWHDRDSEHAHRQLGEAWALLKAGCEFTVNKKDTDGKTIWIDVVSEGFMYHETREDEDKLQRHFYLPTKGRLEAAGEGDWY